MIFLGRNNKIIWKRSLRKGYKIVKVCIYNLIRNHHMSDLRKCLIYLKQYCTDGMLFAFLNLCHAYVISNHKRKWNLKVSFPSTEQMVVDCLFHWVKERGIASASWLNISITDWTVETLWSPLAPPSIYSFIVSWSTSWHRVLGPEQRPGFFRPWLCHSLATGTSGISLKAVKLLLFSTSVCGKNTPDFTCCSEKFD